MDERQKLLNKLGSAIFPRSGLDDLLAMASHASGFKRENAVRRLGMLGNPMAIPHLIVRANDWVPQVRAAARDALSALLRAGNGEAFVASLPAIMHLQTCTRDDHTGLLHAVQEFLLREDNAHHLVAGLHGPDRRVARLAIRLLVERRRMTATELVAVGLSHKDEVVRSTVIDLLKVLEAGDFSAVVAKALCDPYMPVRREAFQQLMARDPEAGLCSARDLLFDGSASIREIAVRRLLAAAEPVEQIYADALTRDRSRVAVVTCVLWGWAFMNSQTRIEQVRQHLNARLPSVRRSALQTIAKLLRNDAKHHLEAALADESPAVCKEAARLIISIDDKPGVARLISIARQSGQCHVAIACCRVARHGSKWDWLKFILKAYGAVDAAVTREAVSKEIDTWEQRFNRSSAQPDSGSMDEIVSALHACEDQLTAKQLQLLRFTLRCYGAPL
jgi:HEAT repeat protein